MFGEQLFGGELGLVVFGFVVGDGFGRELGLGVVGSSGGSGGEFDRERCGAVVVGESTLPPNWKG